MTTMRKGPHLATPRLALASEPDISPAYKTTISAALRWAWERVRAQWPDIVASGREEEITERFCLVLNEQDEDGKRLAPGLDLFETVVRGAKVVAADGRIEKAPDLVFRPVVGFGVRDRGAWGLFVECKIIDDKDHHSPVAYCQSGVARFVGGEYAARVPSGLMLAYVRNRLLPHPALSKVLTGLEYQTVSHVAGTTADTSQSAHGRSGLSKPCVDITLAHLWLQAA